MSFITDILTKGLGQYGIDIDVGNLQSTVNSVTTEYVKDRINSAFKKSMPDPNKPFSPAQGNLKIDRAVETIEREVRLEFKAEPNAPIPVVYGDAWVEPLLVDAVLVNGGCTMWYAVALAEKTGSKVSDSTDSVIEFREILLDDQRMVFDNDGVTLRYLASQGAVNTDVAGLIKVYPYNNGSLNPASHVLQFDTPLHGPANTIMPGWGGQHLMTNLVFALIRVDYDKETEITGIGSMRFKLRNSMKLPGDVMYDLLTNDIYGAGFSFAEVDV